MKLVLQTKCNVRVPFKLIKHSLLSYLYLMSFSRNLRIIGINTSYFFFLVYWFLFKIIKKSNGKFVFAEKTVIRFNAKNTQFQSIYLPHYFEPETLTLIDIILESDAIFFDIGSNWGHYSLYVASNGSFKGKVFSFEPHPDSFSDLTRTISQAQLQDTVKCYPFGLSNTNQEAYIFLPDGMHSGIAKVSTAKVGTKINTRRIDDLDLPNPTLIKMDVEGHEYLVLQGARETIKRAKPIIIFENHKSLDETFQSLDYLKELGYVFYHSSFFKLDNGHPVLYGYQYSIPKNEPMNLGLWEFETDERFFLPSLVNIIACHKDMTLKLSSKFRSNIC
jgi:FkbM family methyltransferase